MNKFASVLLLVSVMTHHSHGQMPFLGGCPTIPPARMTLNDMVGAWFEAERYFFFPEVTNSCVSVNYLLNGNSLDTQISFAEAITNTQKVVLGRVDPLNSPVDGRVQLTIQNVAVPVIPIPAFGLAYPYNVVFINNDIMIKFACRNVQITPLLVPFNFQTVWVLVKDRTYPTAIRDRVRAELRRLSIDARFLQRTNANCPANPNVKGALVENEIFPQNSTISFNQ